MKRLLCAAIFTIVSVPCFAEEITLPALKIPANRIGEDWSGPTSAVVIDDVDSPPEFPKEAAPIFEALLKQMKTAGVRAYADFTYRKNSDPKKYVTLQVSIFDTTEKCQQWIAPKPGWEERAEKVDGKDYTAFDTLKVKMRIAALGKVGISGHTNADSDDHLKSLIST